VAGASNNIRECHKNEFHIIPKILESIQNNTSFKVFGNNYSTYDGTCIRDYVHVKDVALANLLCLEYLIDKNKSIILNIGSGKGTSILDLIQCFQQMGYEITYEFAESKNVDSPILIADISKAIEELNWNPVNSNISTIVQDCLKFQLNIP
jgi:UDP-glucose 4-epimerase